MTAFFSRGFFILGCLTFVSLSWVETITGIEITRLQRIEGYAIAAVWMIFGIGLWVLRVNKKGGEA